MITRHFLVAAAAVSLAACAGGPGYVASSGADAYGYSEQAIGDNAYRITFNGRQTLRDERLADYALRRAAEITLADGYEWFVVSNAESPVADFDRDNTVRVIPAQSVPKIAAGGLRPGRIQALGAVTNRPFTPREARPRESISFDITLGAGLPPEGALGYYAADVLEVPDAT